MTADPSIFRVATYNVRKCVGLDRRRKPGRVIDVINSLAADVVAIQEADRRLGARPATLPRAELERSTDLEPIEISENQVSLGWHGNAILVRKGTTVLATQRLELPGLEPRGAALAEIEGNGETYRVIATHLGLTRQMRRAQLAQIAEQIAKRPVMPTIILGDFNEWSRNRGLEPLHRYQVHAPGRSYHAARPMAALDRIAVDPSLELWDAGVDEAPLALRASDHLPVWADLRTG